MVALYFQSIDNELFNSKKREKVLPSPAFGYAIVFVLASLATSAYGQAIV